MDTAEPQWSSDHPYLNGGFKPIAKEFHSLVLEVRGEVPKSLYGRLSRIGPNPQFEPRDNNHHWFVGQGMIHNFDFENGNVRYTNAWVKTPRWKAEREAGCSLFGSWGNPATSDPRSIGVTGGAANTNIIRHADKMLALAEINLPFEVDPKTFVGIGHCSFGESIGQTFTAHPKTDPVTGELLFFGHSARGLGSPAIAYGAISTDGSVTRSGVLDAPYASLAHDCAITENYLVIPVLPVVCDPSLLRSDRAPYRWDPSLRTHLAVVARAGDASEVRWFSSDPCFIFHTVNAWEDEDKIILLVIQFDTAPLFPDASGDMAAPDAARGRLCRWTIDLTGKTSEFKREYLDDMSAEFPRVDDRLIGRKSDRSYFASDQVDGAPNFCFRSISSFNEASGRRDTWALGSHDMVSEPVFAPRADDSASDDGFLLATGYSAEENRSRLMVFDAAAVAAGPIAEILVPHRVPAGFHGNWFAGAIT